MTTADEFKSHLRKELDDLIRVRDELKLQAHLGAAEAKDEWRKLEDKLVSLQSEFERIGEQAKPSLDEIRSGAEKLVNELRDGFARLKKSSDN